MCTSAVWVCVCVCLKCFSCIEGIYGSHVWFLTLCVHVCKPMWNVCLLLNTLMCVCVCLVALIESGPWEAGCLSCGVVISSHCVTGWVRWQSLTVKSISQINIAKACSPGSMNNECSHFGSKLACCLAGHAWAHLCVSARLPLSPSMEEYSHKLLIINWPVGEGSERFITLLWVSVCDLLLDHSKKWPGMGSGVWILCRATDKTNE